MPALRSDWQPMMLRVRRVDTAGDGHALIFLERPRVEHNEVRAGCLELAQLGGRDARRAVTVLDELAERLRRHIDAAEELAARGLPGGAAPFQDFHRRVAKLAQTRGGELREALTAIEYDDGGAAPRHEVADQHFQ